MAPRQRLPSAFETRSFVVQVARSSGVGRGRLQGPDLARPFWGVRMPLRAPDAQLFGASADPDDHPGHVAAQRALALARAYAPRLKPGQFFSHVTAARLHGIPLPASLDQEGRLDVSVPSPRRAARAVGIRGHKQIATPSQVVSLDGLPVSAPAQVWRELGPLLSVEDLICVGDYLLWWRHPRASLHQLEVIARSRLGCPGTAKLLEAIPLLTDRSDSPPESRIRHRFLIAGLPAVAVNEEIYDQWGSFLAMPDLAFRRYRMVIDYEGDHHRRDRVQWQKDIARVPRLEGAGWHSTRVSALDLRDSRELIGRLKRLLRERGWTG
ncbi:hypothetical protein [Frigoribacterium sp. CG_9.8]|uniref:hypothetical protein n=1 Tax=Frigoribacterium sp. CG_9.8 TaxID=2787733 RepID=UPI0018C94E9D|nr:hypothetical protein [Frigoribacterium sp. CG_9.8]MBG6106711.1 hypothetical protein [Frigoribacterium sp. CG_9.8]